MPLQKSKTARTTAAAVLNQFDSNTKQNYVGPILNELLPQTAQKQRATDLVFGTIRNRSAIDIVIAELADCPTERIPAKLLNTIRIGAYELIYCPQTPEYSIVNEAVESAKSNARRKQVGFVNAVLRQIARHIKHRQFPLSQANATKTLPQTLSTGCEFDKDILSDPKPADFLSAAFSLPKWLVADWLTQFGQKKTQQICFASNRQPSIYLRPNRLKTTISHLSEKFHQANIDAEIVTNSMLKVKSPAAITELPGFNEGLFSIQDITASQALRLLQLQPNSKILDLCAAPGTKTTQLAELTDDKAQIVATDINSQRLQKVRENTARLGISSVKVVEYDNLRQAAAELGPFDTILLDVPCSNTGVLAKRPEARYRIKPNAIKQLEKTQLNLLKIAAGIIKPRAKICYSTCSIQTAENTNVIRKFLQKNVQLTLISEDLTLPSAQDPDRDGGYVAIITTK